MLVGEADRLSSEVCDFNDSLKCFDFLSRVRETRASEWLFAGEMAS